MSRCCRCLLACEAQPPAGTRYASGDLVAPRVMSTDRWRALELQQREGGDGVDDGLAVLIDIGVAVQHMRTSLAHLRGHGHGTPACGRQVRDRGLDLKLGSDRVARSCFLATRAASHWLLCSAWSNRKEWSRPLAYRDGLKLRGIGRLVGGLPGSGSQGKQRAGAHERRSGDFEATVERARTSFSPNDQTDAAPVSPALRAALRRCVSAQRVGPAGGRQGMPRRQPPPRARRR
jgi:hypothetical protein